MLVIFNLLHNQKTWRHNEAIEDADGVDLHLQLNKIIISNKKDHGDEVMEMAGDDPKVTTSSNSWAKLQISPDNIGSMLYGNMLLKIYERAANRKNKEASPSLSASGTVKKSLISKYYYAPILLLDRSSASSSFNNVTKQSEMEFRVEMWNDDVQAKMTAMNQHRKYFNLEVLEKNINRTMYLLKILSIKPVSSIVWNLNK